MPRFRFARSIPDLIQPDEYGSDPDGRLVRFRLEITPDGLEIVGDGARAELVERLFAALDPEEIEEMLCG